MSHGRGACRLRRMALPAVDAVTLKEDSRREIVDGRVIEVMPAEEPHGHRHFELPRVLGQLLAPGYLGAVDMVTRTAQTTEFAPDVSVYPAARDPVTAGRQVDELAFEVIDATRLATVTDKAQRLVARGVRRVFVVDVNANTVSEWSAKHGRWDVLAPDTVLVDRCLATPVPVGALLDAMQSEGAIVRAMKARGVPALMAEIAAGEDRGKGEGMAPLVRMCERKLGRALTVDGHAALRQKLDAVGPERLGDAVLDLPPDELARWLRDPAAR